MRHPCGRRSSGAVAARAGRPTGSPEAVDATPRRERYRRGWSEADRLAYAAGATDPGVNSPTWLAIHSTGLGP